MWYRLRESTASASLEHDATMGAQYSRLARSSAEGHSRQAIDYQTQHRHQHRMSLLFSTISNSNKMSLSSRDDILLG